MGGLFGGKKDPPPTPQPVTLAAPPPLTPQAAQGQSAAQIDALKKAQTASTLATDKPAEAGDTYSKTALG